MGDVDRLLVGIHPAVVESYSKSSRTCRISIPGIMDGGSVFAEAEIQYPIGDKSWAGEFSTEIEILSGDHVWVQFIGGDFRYPVITGYRCTNVGNSEDWRRWHHKNVEIIGDEHIIIRAERIDLNP